MEAALDTLAGFIALVLDFFAVLAVLLGSIQAAISIARLVARRDTTNLDRRAVWLQFASWLGAALTFQLGADIVQTTIAPTWNDIGRVAAIAAIRTFLVYFLEHDIETVGERQRRRQAEA